MSSFIQNAIPFTFRYLDFSEGEPREREEKRHFYFTMGAVKRMYEVAEVDEEQMEKAIEKGELNQGDALPRADDDEEEPMGFEELYQHFDFAVKVMWAGLLAEAEARGEVLTIEHVGHILTADQFDDASTAAMKAFYKFQSGLSDEQQSDLADDLQETGKPKSQSV
jgi:hypothetical protein